MHIKKSNLNQRVVGWGKASKFYNVKYTSLCFCFCFAGVNYKKLTDESSDPLATLQPVLTSQNVQSISKLSNRLPLPGGGKATVSASAVHALWLQKLFWKGDPQLLKRPPRSDQDYLHAYNTCAKYLDKLVPTDAIRFLDSITFSPDAAKNVSSILPSYSYESIFAKQKG